MTLAAAISQLGTQITAEQRQLDRRMGQAQALVQQGKDLTARTQQLDEHLEACNEAIGILQSFGEQRQRDLQVKVETLVTHGLRTIFGADMSFHILHKNVGKLAAMDFVIRTDLDGQQVETSILDARGGGVAAVAGFLIRLIVLLLSKDTADPVLLLDETFAQLSAEYEPRLAEFLRELVDKTPAQIVLVTHSEAYSDVADQVYRFRLEHGVTRIMSAADPIS